MDASSLQGQDLSQIPAGPPPPGVIPNLAHPQTLEKVTIEIGVVFMCVGIVSCAVNLWYHRKQFRRPEYCIVIALPFVIAYTAMVIAYSPDARHTWETPLSLVFERRSHNIQLAELMISVPAGLLPKTAVLCLYLEIFKVDRRFTIAAYVAFALALADYLPWLILGPVFCSSTGPAWNLNELLKCKKLEIWAVVQSPLNLMLDLFLFIMPIPPIIKLQLPIRRKIAIIAVFATALLGIAASCISVVYRAMLFSTDDATWYTHMCEMAAFIENWIALIVCCAPGCAGQFRHLQKKATGTTSKTASGQLSTAQPGHKSRTDSSTYRGSFEDSEATLKGVCSISVHKEKQHMRDELDFDLDQFSQDTIHEIDQV